MCKDYIEPWFILPITWYVSMNVLCSFRYQSGTDHPWSQFLCQGYLNQCLSVGSSMMMGAVMYRSRWEHLLIHFPGQRSSSQWFGKNIKVFNRHRTVCTIVEPEKGSAKVLTLFYLFYRWVSIENISYSALMSFTFSLNWYLCFILYCCDGAVFH